MFLPTIRRWFAPVVTSLLLVMISLTLTIYSQAAFAQSITFNKISLAPIANFNYQNQNPTIGYSNPPRGDVVLGNVGLGGIPFFIPDNNNAFNTNIGNNYSQRISTNIPNPLKVHLLLNSGNTWSPSAGQEIGSITLDFDDGDLFETKLIIGQNIREWSPHSNTVNTVTDQQSQLVFSENSRSRIIDMLSFDVPANYQNKILTGVRVTDSYNDNIPGYNTNPVILWSGLTIQGACQVSPHDVKIFAGDPDLDGKPTTMNARFEPTDTNGQPNGLNNAATACGFDHFNWLQTVTMCPHCDTPGVLTASGINVPFFDPPVGYLPFPAAADNLPFYWNEEDDPLNPDSCRSSEGVVFRSCQQGPDSQFFNPDYLKFYDQPTDPSFTGSEEMRFTTELVGVTKDGQESGHLYEFKWSSNYTGSRGEVRTFSNPNDVDTGGTGGITITSINGVPQTPPHVSCSAAPKTLWPPNGKSVSVTVAGSITPGTQPISPSDNIYAVIDEYSQVQPAGSITLGAGGSYSFQVSLIAARNGNDKDGRTYTVIVRGKDNIGNVGSCSTVVTVPHDQSQ